MLAILFKEINEFFSSLVAFIAIGAFLLVTGLFLWIFPDTSIMEYGYANLDGLFSVVPFTFMFLIPAITMRTIAEEHKDGTFELLTTRPVSDWELVLGKYFAALLIVLLTLMPTLVYYFSVYQLGLSKGNLDSGAITGSYLGLFLLGGVFTSIGIFASSVAQNQIIAFIVGVLLCLFAFSGLDTLAQIPVLQVLDDYLAILSANEHYQSMSRGVLDSRDLCYFLSVIMLFLASSKTKIGGRKW